MFSFSSVCVEEHEILKLKINRKYKLVFCHMLFYFNKKECKITKNTNTDFKREKKINHRPSPFSAGAAWRRTALQEPSSGGWASYPLMRPDKIVLSSDIVLIDSVIQYQNHPRNRISTDSYRQITGNS